MTRIRELRKHAGLTQSDLAKVLGVEQSTIARWESGKSEPGISSIRKLATVFEIEVSDLIAAFAEQNPKDVAAAVSLQTPDDRPIYRLLTGKDDRAFCERVSEALAQGWRLYGSPTMTYDGGMDCIKVAQAVVWHEADVVK